MKKAALFIFPLLAFVGATAQVASPFSIKAFIPFWRGAQVQLKIDGQLVQTDTLLHDVYSFTGKTDQPRPALLEIRTEKQTVFVPFFIEPGTIKIRDKGSKVLEAFGTQSNDTYLKLKKQMDSAAAVGYTGVLSQAKDRKRAMAAGYISSNPTSVVSLQLLYDYFYINNAVDDTLYFSLYDALHPTLKQTTVGKKLAAEAAISRATALGVVAPNLMLPDTAKNVLPLYQPGQLTFVDFWASWCVPCRRENPALVRLYQQYKTKGLAIVSVSLDTSPLLWKEAIKKDKLAWKHVSDGKAWNGTAAVTYGIKTIPTNFLIDGRGVIIAKNLHTEELQARLQQLLH